MKLSLPLKIAALLSQLVAIGIGAYLFPRKVLFQKKSTSTHDKYAISIITLAILLLFFLILDDCLALYSIGSGRELEIYSAEVLMSPIFRYSSGLLFGTIGIILVPRYTAFKFQRFYFNAEEKSKFEKMISLFQNVILPTNWVVLTLTFLLTDIIPFDRPCPWLRTVLVMFGNQFNLYFVASLVKDIKLRE